MENKNINGKVQRGEIYLYDFGNNGGSIQNGVRPALVVQCNEGNAASSTTIIAAMTSIIKKQYLPSHIILGDQFGLKEPSMVMLEQLKTVNQSDFIEYIGKIDDEHYMKRSISASKRQWDFGWISLCTSPQAFVAFALSVCRTTKPAAAILSGVSILSFVSRRNAISARATAMTTLSSKEARRGVNGEYFAKERPRH